MSSLVTVHPEADRPRLAARTSGSAISGGMFRDLERIGAVVGLLLLSLATSCTTAVASDCSPGACTGPGGCRGTRVCDPVISCACVLEDGGATGAPTGSVSLGGSCASDRDCSANLVCIGSESTDLGGAGVAGGLCTADCSDDPSLCRTLDSRGMCVTVGEQPGRALCLEACVIGTPGPGESKCHDRGNLACTSLSGNDRVGACYPTCASDADCAPRFCDPASGLCVDAMPEGAPNGAPCGAGLPACSGLCLELEPGFEFCTSACRLGTVGCGATSQQGPFRTFCGLSSSIEYGFGDEGLCIEACDCNDDCSHTMADCVRLSDPDLEAVIGHRGACLPAAAAEATISCEP